MYKLRRRYPIKQMELYKLITSINSLFRMIFVRTISIMTLQAYIANLSMHNSILP